MALDKSQWEAILKDVKVSRESTYRILTIDLGIARTEQFIGITGSAVFVVTATDANSNAQVRLNESQNDQFTLKKQQGVISPFYGFFITNTAQSGKSITLGVATQVPDLFQFIDNATQADISATLSALLDELKGLSTMSANQTAVGTGAPALALIAANTGRKSCFVQNDPGSDGDLVLYYDNTVATNKCWVRLRPGESWGADDYTGAIWPRAVSGSAVKANWNEVA